MKFYFNKTSIILPLIFIIFTSCLNKNNAVCDKLDTNDIVIAKIGNNNITYFEFCHYIKNRIQNPDDFISISKDKKIEILNELIMDRLMLMEGLKNNLDKDNRIVKKLAKEENNLMIKWLYKIEISDKLRISDNEIRKEYYKFYKNGKYVPGILNRVKNSITQKKSITLENELSIKLYDKYQLNIIPASIEKVILIYIKARKYTEAKNGSKTSRYNRPYIKTLDSMKLNNNDKKTVVAKYNNNEFTLEDLFYEYLQIIPPQRPKLIDQKSIEDFIKKILLRKLYLAEAENRHYYKNPEVKKEVNLKKNQFILQKFKELEISKKTREYISNENHLRNYFKKNKEKYKVDAKGDSIKEEIEFQKVKMWLESDLVNLKSKEIKDKLIAKLKKQDEVIIYSDKIK